jgi:hypothetical protein
VTGILSTLTCCCNWIPIIGVVPAVAGIVLGGVAIALGILGLKRAVANQANKVMSIAGISTGALGALAGIALIVLYSIGMYSPDTGYPAP